MYAWWNYQVILVLHSNKKTFFYPQRLIKSLDQKESNTLMKVFINTMEGMFLVQAIKGVLFMPKIITQCMCNTPFRVY